ncbi:DUF5916 domain-containing protein [Winogradskyella immobilis]|uniref:Carbohydrate binding family 9 domain-containing protein n=1 Tax=Winogradskyella immobilis TaxID=2816852 RepID=A0ABS8EM38_9FLAO|nr:DUF5916 domain-containing protein [Winogradskyella immobilis]MCC1484155.1 carbohydrate binding family 9 domain-containing protein [Winogradskyella immobilis]
MIKRFVFFILTMLAVNGIHAQAKKALHIKRADVAPIIDGVLDDSVWENAEIATDFIQFQPEIGNKNPNEQRTEVKITYDDEAIYISAYLYDNPDLILRQFTRRDDFGQSDFFMVVLNPNNDAQNDTNFAVTSSGTQADALVNPTIGEDFTWNAVWDSAVKIVDDGWIVELKIPYRALRFTAQEEPIWGLQLHRHFRRTRAQFTWNPIDVTQGNIGLYHGELYGLNNIKPPIRLNLYPFSTGIASTFDGESETDLNFGLDLKYGITDNLTLDATLVPDFSQAGFDNLALNLGPFEQTFAEQRQFFTEGVDLFSKGGLFFSRRIGNQPSGELNLTDDESVDLPNEVKVLNVVKVSGRTKKGLGIGLLNAITEETSATITDDITGEQRQEIVEPFANYNVLVVDQQFNGNSSISLINTNVLREGGFRDGNATALVSNFQNKRNTYQVNTELKLSHVNFQTSEAETGFSSSFLIGKTHGNFRYSAEHNFADTKYDINDLGLNLRNNFNNFGIDASYQTFEPKGNLNSYRITGSVDYEQLASPNTFTGIAARLDFFAQHKSLNGFGFNLRSRPGKQFNFFESRDGRPFIFENFVRLGGFYSSNYNKPFAFDFSGSIASIFEDGRDFFSYNIRFSPRFRFNDHILLIFNSEFDRRRGERGFATFEDDEPLLGNRKRRRITNTISANYSFNSNNTLAINFRHNWDTVNYDNELFTLIGETGRVTTDTGFTLDNISSDPNVNFSTWNFDLSYSWQFAPGSFLTALYRNQLLNINERSEDTFTGSLDTLFDEPIQHIFSLRVQYFIDFNGIKSIFKKNNTSS